MTCMGGDHLVWSLSALWSIVNLGPGTIFSTALGWLAQV
jgi:hypothetical protein